MNSCFHHLLLLIGCMYAAGFVMTANAQQDLKLIIFERPIDANKPTPVVRIDKTHLNPDDLHASYGITLNVANLKLAHGADYKVILKCKDQVVHESPFSVSNDKKYINGFFGVDTGSLLAGVYEFELVEYFMEIEAVVAVSRPFFLTFTSTDRIFLTGYHLLITGKPTSAGVAKVRLENRNKPFLSEEFYISGDADEYVIQGARIHVPPSKSKKMTIPQHFHRFMGNIDVAA